MRYRQQKRKSRGFGLKMCCNFYIILEIQSFHRSLITRYHNSSMKIAIINKKTGKFCTCKTGIDSNRFESNKYAGPSMRLSL